MKRTIRIFTVFTLVFASLTVGFLISYRFSGDRVTLLGAGIFGTLTGTFLFATHICILDYYFGTKENKNAEDLETDKSEFPHITAAEAYIQSLPYIEKNVWKDIHYAIEAGKNSTYLRSGENAKIPRKIIKELLDKNYRVEVIELSFHEFPSLEVFFNQTSTGELYLRVDEDGYHEYSYRPLSLEEYDKIAK